MTQSVLTLPPGNTFAHHSAISSAEPFSVSEEVYRRELGQLLEHYRNRAGLSIAEMAAQIRISELNLVKLESGERAIPDRIVERIAVVVGENPARLTLECLFIKQPRSRESSFGKSMLQVINDLC